MLSSSTISLLSLNSMKAGLLLVFHILAMYLQDWFAGDSRDRNLKELLSIVTR